MKIEKMPVESLRYSPQGPLALCVQCLWYWQGAPRTHSKERLLPNGEPALIFNLRDDPIRIYDAEDLSHYESFGHAVFSGPRSGCFAIDTCQQERVVGVQFRAGGAFPFLRMPLCETEDQSVDLDDLWAAEASLIRERLLAQPSAPQILRELERCLQQQLLRDPAPHPAIAYALGQFEQQSPDAARVGAVGEQTGLSPRRFIELFRRQVGLTPKTFCRVRRFQRVLQTVHGAPEPDWVQIALACGYYDQAHFIHDFRSFSGLTPGAYLQAATPHLNHVPLSA